VDQLQSCRAKHSYNQGYSGPLLSEGLVDHSCYHALQTTAKIRPKMNQTFRTPSGLHSCYHALRTIARHIFENSLHQAQRTTATIMPCEPQLNSGLYSCTQLTSVLHVKIQKLFLFIFLDKLMARPDQFSGREK